MSKIALEGNASGTGTLTIASQNTNSNYTLTLPNSTGTLVVTGGAQTIEFAAGTAAAPSITFTGDTNTGIFSPGADSIGFAEGGAEIARFDSSGNFGIGGTATSGYKLDVQVSGTSRISVRDTASTGVARVVANSVDAFFGNESSTGSTIFQTQATERMRINSSGNVGIGTTTPLLTAANRTSLTVNGTTDSVVVVSSGGTERCWLYGVSGTAVLAAGTSSSLNFEANGAERARIDSSGRLLVNTTSSISSTAYIQAATNGGNGSTGWIGMFATGANLANQNAGYMIGQSNLQMYAAWDGSANARNNIYMTAVSNGVVLNNGASSWSAISDARLKNVTGTYQNALSDIAQIEPIKFTWKNDAENKPQVGVIAQSVQNVVPEAIEFGSHPNLEDKDTEYMSVRYTELIPLMIASIQELKAITDAQATRIEALEAEVAALKGQ